MDNINEINAPILDKILKICIYDNGVTKDNLPDIESDDFAGKIPDYKLNYYRDYFTILKESGIVKVDVSSDIVYINSILGVTKPFFDKGGFTQIYKQNLEEAEHKKLLRKKDIVETENSIFTRKKQKITFIITIISIFLSAFAIAISIWNAI